jgi:azurin
MLTIDTYPISSKFKFTQEILEVPAGSNVTLTFTNKTAPTDNVLHNWVLVKESDSAAVLQDAITAGPDAGWLKKDDSRVIAHTKLIGGGETDVITFAAPPAGQYVFVCSFPGHHPGGMKGLFVVK